MTHRDLKHMNAAAAAIAAATTTAATTTTTARTGGFGTDSFSLARRSLGRVLT